jgi:hypothetical protein
MIVLLLQAVSRIRTRINTDSQYDLLPKIVRDGLIFDLNSYKRPKEVSFFLLLYKIIMFVEIKQIGLADEAKRIMRMQSSDRNDEFVRIAVAALIQAIPEYADFPPNIQKSIVKVCQFEKYESGRVIIRQGHKADNFYFIVSGISKLIQFFKTYFQ